jgi:hypothetical protein
MGPLGGFHRCQGGTHDWWISGEIPARPCAIPVAVRGEIQWPPMRSFAWPPSPLVSVSAITAMLPASALSVFVFGVERLLVGVFLVLTILIGGRLTDRRVTGGVAASPSRCRSGPLASRLMEPRTLATSRTETKRPVAGRPRVANRATRSAATGLLLVSMRATDSDRAGTQRPNPSFRFSRGRMAPERQRTRRRCWCNCRPRPCRRSRPACHRC